MQRQLPLPFINFFPSPASAGIPVAVVQTPFGPLPVNPAFVPAPPPMVHRHVFHAAHPVASVASPRIHMPVQSPVFGVQRVELLIVDSAAGHYQFMMHNKYGPALGFFGHNLRPGQSESSCLNSILDQAGLPHRHLKHFDITDHSTGHITRIYVYHFPGVSGSRVNASLSRNNVRGQMKRLDACSTFSRGFASDVYGAVFNINSTCIEALTYAATNIAYLV
jgi:hypothetical protein